MDSEEMRAGRIDTTEDKMRSNMSLVSSISSALM